MSMYDLPNACWVFLYMHSLQSVRLWLAYATAWDCGLLLTVALTHTAACVGFAGWLWRRLAGVRC